MFCSVFLQSLFCFLRLYGHTLKLKDSFLSCVQSTNKPIKGIHHFLKIILFIYLFLALLGLCCYEGFSLVVASRGYSPVAMHELLTVVASLSWSTGSRAWAQQLQFSGSGT